jgi:hypothetical protein
MRLASILCTILLSLLPAHSVNITLCPQHPTWFCVDGVPTHSGTPEVTGLLLNSRMIQGIFDDANATTRPLWAYPGGAPYDAARQTAEFVGNLSSYAACGLDAVTVGMQGGGPEPTFPADQPNESSGFARNGTPLPAYLTRLTSVLAGAARARLVPIISLFYQGQVERLDGDAAVATAVDAMVDWLVAGGHAPHVVLEIANEVGCAAFPPSLQPEAVHLLIARAAARAQGALLVSTSFLPSVTPPPDAAVAASAFVTLHCNGLTAAEIGARIAGVKGTAAWQAHPKPIVFNECGTNLTAMDAAIAGGASWGYYDQGRSDYKDGFQAPPTNWNLSAAPLKHAFFARLAQYTRAQQCEA